MRGRAPRRFSPTAAKTPRRTPARTPLPTHSSTHSRIERLRQVGAAAHALLVKHVHLAVCARRRAAPRANRTPVPALQDRGPTALGALGPFVDVAGHVVDAEDALAPGARAA